MTYKDEKGVTETVDLKAAIKAHETVTKLIDNNNGTLTYYNESEIDSAGLPIANTGLTFRIPKTESYELTNVLTPGNAQNYPSEWDYETMVNDYDGVDFYALTHATPTPIFTSYFDTNQNPGDTKFMNFDFFVECTALTIGNTNPNKQVLTELEVQVLINDVLVKRFFPLRYTFGKEEGYEQNHIRHYGGILSYSDNLNLVPTNNKLEIRICPTRTSFYNNEGTRVGSFFRGSKTLSIRVLDPIFHIFEKQ